MTEYVPAPPTPLAPPHVPEHLIIEVAPYLAANNASDPWGVVAEVLNTLPPIFYSPGWRVGTISGSWILTHYEDIREIYQNPEFYSTADVADFQKLVGETFQMIPLSIDPPDHGKYRILLNPWFSPKAINQMEESIRGAVNELIDRFVNKGECDVAYDFGRLYPVRVFMDLMGFPQARLEEFLSWEYAILHSNGDLERVQWGMRSALAYLRGFIEEVRAAPRNDLTSYIVHGEVEGRPLTEDEIIGTVAFLWIGGLDTVAATTSLMFRRLALNSNLQQRLRDKSDLISDAVEEFLRMQPIVNSTRLVKLEHQIRGVTIKPGDHVACLNAAGNFDPAEFQCPHEFRLDRSSNRHFTLAGGAHRCLGSHLARRELRIALGEFLRRVPTFSIKPGADVAAQPGLVAMSKLPLVWQA